MTRRQEPPGARPSRRPPQQERGCHPAPRRPRRPSDSRSPRYDPHRRGRHGGRPSVAEVGSVLADALEAEQALAAGASVELRLDARGALPSISVDRARMLQVFENLVGNTLKLTPGNDDSEIGLLGKPSIAGSYGYQAQGREGGQRAFVRLPLRSFALAWWSSPSRSLLFGLRATHQARIFRGSAGPPAIGSTAGLAWASGSRGKS